MKFVTPLCDGYWIYFCRSKNPSKYCYDRLLAKTDHSVLDLYWSYPTEASLWHRVYQVLTLDHLMERKDFYINLLRCIGYDKPIAPRYKLDWDVNMRVAEKGWLEERCAEMFKTNQEFMTEVIRRCPWYFGSNEFCCEPAFMKHVLQQIPCLLEFVQINYSKSQVANFGHGEFRTTRSYLYEFQHASKELRDNESLALIHVKQFERQATESKGSRHYSEDSINSMLLLSDRLLSDRTSALKAVRSNSQGFFALNPILQREDLEIVNQAGLAGKLDPDFLRYASTACEWLREPRSE